MSLKEIFEKTLSGRYTTPDKIAAEYPNGVTLVGFSYVEVKGKQTPSYRIAEDGGQTFLASGKLLMELTERLLSEYETAEALDAALRAEPVMIQIFPLVELPNKNKFRFVKYLGAVDQDTGEVT